MTAAYPKTKDNPLDFQKYLSAARARNFRVPQEATPYNGLLAETDHFFVINGLGSMLPGYVLILPKQEFTSFACVPKEYDQESEWLIHTMADIITQKYGVKPVHFEHGKAHFTGGTDHAHYHIMPLADGISHAQMLKAVESTLNQREVGINKITLLDGVEITDQCKIASTIHTARQDIEEIHGTRVHYQDIQKSAATTPPLTEARTLTNNGQHYVYFHAPDQKVDLLTHHAMGSQVCREFSAKALEAVGAVDASEWNWAHHPNFKNMQQTMSDLAGPLSELAISGKGQQFGFKSRTYPEKALARVNDAPQSQRAM